MPEMNLDEIRDVTVRNLRMKSKPAPHADQEFMNVFEDFVADTTGVWDYRESEATPEGFNAYCNLLADLIERADVQ